MKIEDGIKLDFSDVLFRPKRSTLSSRKEVSLTRTYKFKHSQQEYTGVPVMAANMDGVGTLAMAEELNNHGMFTCLIKNYNNIEIEWFDGEINFDNTAISTGISEQDYTRLKNILEYCRFKYICIDVANGYSEAFVSHVSNIRKI